MALLIEFVLRTRRQPTLRSRSRLGGGVLSGRAWFTPRKIRSNSIAVICTGTYSRGGSAFAPAKCRSKSIMDRYAGTYLGGNPVVTLLEACSKFRAALWCCAACFAVPLVVRVGLPVERAVSGHSRAEPATMLLKTTTAVRVLMSLRDIDSSRRRGWLLT